MTMQTVVLLMATVLFLGLIILGFYNLLYSREVYKLEDNIGVRIPNYIHRLLKTVTILAFLFGFSGFLVALTHFFSV